MTLGDIYFVLFRHKWKILLISLVSVITAAAVYFAWPVPYQSEAKLFVRYVVETEAPVQSGANGPKVKMPGERGGENVINTEMEILSSLDLAQAVADLIGPEKILAKAGGGTNRYQAAAVIQGGLVPEVGKKSDVIHVLFKHSDPELVQPVLRQVVETYLTKHAETHRAIGVFDDFLTKQTDQLRTRLSATEDELHKAKLKVGVFSVEDSKKIYTEQMSKIQQTLLEAEADVAERRAQISAMGKLLPSNSIPPLDSLADPGPATGTNAVKLAGSTPAPPVLTSNGTNVANNTNGSPALRTLAAGNPVPSETPTNNAVTDDTTKVPSEIVADYLRVHSLLEALSKRQTELLVQFTPESPLVKGVQSQIADAEKRKSQLEKDHPGLLVTKTNEARTAASNVPGAAPVPQGAQTYIMVELAKVAAIETKIKKLTEQLDKIRGEATVISEAEGTITDLERKKVLEEAQYNYSQRNLEEARVDAQLGAVRNSDVNVVQTPSPPFRDQKKLTKIAMGILFGGIAAALGLAFVIELFLDPSLKRPMEIETKVGLPLFLAVPRLRLNGYGKVNALNGAPKVPQLAEASESAPSGSPFGDQVVLPHPQSVLPTWDVHHPLRPFHEALRDRLITYFEVKNLTHKPKLVAMTNCTEGAGVTTLAAGLAASLSETGDGNVLLVDMNQQGEAHQFYHGALACGLDDALELDKRDGALVKENLYVVREPHRNGSLPCAMPKRFQHLVPKLRASDYDYIIFDLPTISQISITSRLARFMDITFIVVEAEQTDRDVVKRAAAMLAESGANLGIVLNKSRTYIPRSLLQEI